MPRTRITDVLREVFRTYGFDTTSPAHPESPDGTIHRVDILAEKNGMDVVVLVHEDTAPLAPSAIAAHAQKRSAIGARYAIAATLSEISAQTEAAAAQTGTLLWDREAIARAIGRAVLLEATGESDSGDAPVAELLAIAASVAFTQEEHVQAMTPVAAGLAAFLDPDGAPIPVATAAPATAAPPTTMANEAPQREVGRGWYLETSPPPPERRADPVVPRAPTKHVEKGREWFLETSTPSTTGTGPAVEPAAKYAAPGARMGIPPSTGPDPRTFTPEEGILLAPAVGKDAAAATARRQVFTIDHTRLRYHPKRVVRWQVEAFIEGRVETTTLSGTLLVDLAARTIESLTRWETPRTLRGGTFDVPVEGKPLRMLEEHARELVRETILEETSREVTMRDTDPSGDFHITTKRRVRVSPEDIRIEDDGVHWYPVWVFTGVNGETEIDGITGNVLAAHLKGPKGTTMVW